MNNIMQFSESNLIRNRNNIEFNRAKIKDLLFCFVCFCFLPGGFFISEYVKYFSLISEKIKDNSKSLFSQKIFYSIFLDFLSVFEKKYLISHNY